MSRLFLAVFIILSLAITCEDVQPLDGPSFVDVVNGEWRLSDVKRIEQGSVDDIPYYQDYETDSIISSSMAFDDSLLTAEIRFNYLATEIIGGGQFNSGVVEQAGEFDIVGYKMYLYSSPDTIIYVANTVSRNLLELELNTEVNDTSTGQTGFIIERFTWERMK